MSGAFDIPEMAEHLRQKLLGVHGVKGRDLAQSVARAGRMLPRRLRHSAQRLARAEHMVGHPKLEQMVDRSGLRAGFSALTAHLDGIDVAGRRKKRALQLLGLLVCQLAVIVALLLVVLRWRGFL